ncbi:MAG: helix-turn-helix transcriptional regulator [Clostridia bacterium]|nr:helix-turn-helix transcriptional regulator [Clostridia bacterium]
MYLSRLKDLREDHDLTQDTVSQLLGISQQQYSRYEKGEYTIPLDYLIILAKFYKTSADYILGLTNQQKPYRHMD